MNAAATGNTQIIEMLIEEGAEVDALDENYETASMHAARAGRVDAMKLLSRRGANIETLLSKVDHRIVAFYLLFHTYLCSCSGHH